MTARAARWWSPPARAGPGMIAMLAPAVPLLVFLHGCANPAQPAQVCTDVGCSSGLRVELVGTPADTFSITATAPWSDPQVIECRRGEGCYPTFVDYAPPRVTLVYESRDQHVEKTFDVVYQRVRPNGPDCPPECLVATVALDLGT